MPEVLDVDKSQFIAAFITSSNSGDDSLHIHFINKNIDKWSKSLFAELSPVIWLMRIDCNT
jgi:hypothetical protein